MNDHPEVKVGDKMLFIVGYGRDQVIQTVTRITPSGRIICDDGHGYTLNPNLTLRGRGGGYHSPWGGELLTPEREAEVREELRLQSARRMIANTSPDGLSDDAVLRIAEIINEGRDPSRT